MFDTLLESGAEFSKDRKYRYALWRIWERTDRQFVVIGLNPSTADETQDDPTIRRCITFADREKCGGLIMLNLFAWRSTDPTILPHLDDPTGPKNLDVIRAYTAGAEKKIILAWGSNRFARPHAKRLIECLRDWNRKVYTFGFTKAECPKHPLYLHSNTKLQRYL